MASGLIDGLTASVKYPMQEWRQNQDTNAEFDQSHLYIQHNLKITPLSSVLF